MAGNKLNTKTKGKDDKNKSGKGAAQNNDENEDVIDFAVLRKPVPTSITGFAQARKIFDLATEELKDLLTNECDLLYECKVCRNIFRSLANFISHKRLYCKEKFNSATHGHFINSNSVVRELKQIKQLEDDYQQFLKTKQSVQCQDKDENDEQIPLTKDLTAVYEKITQSKGVVESKEDPKMILKKIPSSSIAVFQTVSFEDNKADNIRTEVQELDVILSRDRAVLQSNGKFVIESSKDPNNRVIENVIHISDDEENEPATGDCLKCKICDLQFSTQKTLKFHIKYKHLESRLVYPCPDCLEIFSTSWSVYRHLFKVHRKTAAQVRRLREAIQAKAFRMNNPPASYERRRNMRPAAPAPLTEDELRDRENQAWLDNVESLGSVPRCGGCGRTFERRAALAAHAAVCTPRARALRPPTPSHNAPSNPVPSNPAPSHPVPSNPTPSLPSNPAPSHPVPSNPVPSRPLPPAPQDRDPRKIQIQIRKDYNKEPHGLTILKPAQLQQKPALEEIPARTQPVKDTKSTEKEPEVKDLDEAPMDLEEDDKSDISGDSPVKREVNPEDDIKPVIRLPFALQAEKSNLAAFKHRIASDIDIMKLTCKKCESNHSSVLELYDHMAEHVKWMRYACKLCNYKHYRFDKLPEHVRMVHKLKGDSDFYYSTVKAIDGKEAMMMSTCLSESEEGGEGRDEGAEGKEDGGEESPNARRSRASSDSSRLSDDSGSSTNKETRKRKIYHGKGAAKKKKESNEDGEGLKDVEICKTNSSGSVRTFEENSSDLDEIDEKLTKRPSVEEIPSMHSRRPVRKRTKVKNADFEYDLSNLLKMEAQGYKETAVAPAKPAQVVTYGGKTAPTTTIKANPVKKKVQDGSYLEQLNKDHAGALFTLSKKAVDNASAHMRTHKSGVTSTPASVFARPMLPRILSRGDKASPSKKEDDSKDPNISKVFKASETFTSKMVDVNDTDSACKVNTENHGQNKNSIQPKEDVQIVLKSKPVEKNITDNTTSGDLDETTSTSVHNSTEKADLDDIKKETSSSNIPAIVPITFRRQSLEVMKNPLINKNIAELSKAGMKTKILVIKPINRKGDGRQINTPLKFQTIKLKDPSKVSSSDDKPSDQVMVVQVPKVPCSSVSDKVIELPEEAASSQDIKCHKIIPEKVKESEHDHMKIAENCSEETVLNNRTNENGETHIENDRDLPESTNECGESKPVEAVALKQ